MDAINPFSSATELLAGLRARLFSAEELLDVYLDRIRRFNPALNAVIIVDESGAREAARRADRRRAQGDERALLGLPLTIKDAIDVAGFPTTAGLPRRAQAIASADAPLVSRLRDAGTVIMGKTNVPPYVGDWQTDNPIFGRTNNPWDLQRTPGGSTGGGAAAVAAGLSSIEFGSDVGGSIRVPAAFCGVYGHRPSETAVPSTGHWPGSSLPNVGTVLNVLGPLARSAADLSLALDIVSGAEVGEDTAWCLELPAARHTRLRDYRVAVLPPLPWLPLDPSVEEALESLIDHLTGSRLQVERAVPEGFGDGREHQELYESMLAAIFAFNMDQSASSTNAQAEAERASGHPFEMARAAGLTASARDLLGWYGQRERFRAVYRKFFRHWDVLLAPIVPLPAFLHDARPFGERTLTIAGQTVSYRRLVALPALATLSGQPATAFPVGTTSDGLPIGFQAIGPYLEDHTPIAFAGLMAQEWGGYRVPPGYDSDE